MSWFGKTAVDDLYSLFQFMNSTREGLHGALSKMVPSDKDYEFTVRLLDRQMDLIFSLQEHVLDKLGVEYPLFPEDYTMGDSSHHQPQPKETKDV